MVGLYSAIAKHTKNPGDFNMQYVDIFINGRLARAMVESRTKANIMTKTATERLGMNYVPRTTFLKTINVPQTPMCGVAQ